MTPPLLLAALPGAAIAVGLLLTIAGWRQTRPTATARRAGQRLPGHGTDSRLWKHLFAGGWPEWRWAVALEAGLLTWLLSGWPVAGAAAWAAVLGVPALLGSGRTARATIDRAEAVQGWTRRLADVLLTGAGLEQAITATVTTCPDPLRPPVTALAARLGARWPTETALRAFADDLDDATADLVAATLILGSRRRGPGLARPLIALADSLAEEVALRRKIEAERAKPRATARAVTLVIVGVLLAGSLTGDYLHPYATTTGQVVLGGLLAALAAALFALHQLARTPPPPRLLNPSPADAPEDARQEVLR